MQPLGPSNGSFFSPQLNNEQFASSITETSTKQDSESIVKFEDHNDASVTPLLKEKPLIPSISSVQFFSLSKITQVESKQSEIDMIYELAFGKKKWMEYFGDVGEDPLLPTNIQAILNEPCPYWSEKKVADTHFLVLIPEKVNGQYLTLNTFGDLIKKPKKGTTAKYNVYNDILEREYGDKSGGESHWVLMTRDVLPGTKNKTYTDQKAILSKGCKYEVPSLLEATVSIMMEYILTGKSQYGNEPLTYTRCQERGVSEGESYQNVVGDVDSSGISISLFYIGYYENDYNGLAALRRF